MTVRTAVVIGASRGIGLGLAKRLQQGGWSVYGTMRKAPADLLKAPAFSHIIEDVDVTDATTCQTSLRRALDDVKKIDLLVYNAGIAVLTENFARESVTDVDVDAVSNQINVNALGALRVVQALDDKIASGSKLLFTSTMMSSLQLTDDGAMYGYRTSKTALNMIVKCMSAEYNERGAVVTLAHPGVVQTEMTNHFEGGISVDQCVDGFVRVIDNMSLDNTYNASLVDVNSGVIVPW